MPSYLQPQNCDDRGKEPIRRSVAISRARETDRRASIINFRLRIV